MMTEFGLIEAIREGCKQLPTHGFEGIGDDCAVLPIGGGEALVLTADLVVERVHFLREAATPEEVLAQLGAVTPTVTVTDTKYV